MKSTICYSKVSDLYVDFYTSVEKKITKSSNSFCFQL